jgi:hypothetical protein
MNQLNYHKQLRAIARFLIGILVVVSINLIDSSIFVNRVFGANSSNKNLLNATPDRDKVSICIAGFCVNTPNIPNIIKAPIEQGINSAIRDQLRSFLSSEIPITGTEHKLYPSTPELPGGRFAPNTLYLSALQPSQVIPSGDYEIPVHFYCTKVYTLNGAGNRFRLARLEGRLSSALSNLYQRASLNNVPIQDVQVLSWSIQSGVSYDNLSNESKRLVDRLIPDYRQELNGSFIDQTIRFWNTLAAVTPLPSLDETLNQLGDVGNFTRSLFRAREEIIRSNFNYRNLANNFVLQQDFNLPGGVESTPWSQINDRVYLRFIAPSGALRDGVAQVRILGNSQDSSPITSGALLNDISQSVGIPEQSGQAITATVNPPPEGTIVTLPDHPCNDPRIVTIYDKNNPQYHFYGANGEISNPICSKKIKGCTREKVFAIMISQARFIAPTFDSSPVIQCRTRILTLDSPIKTIINRDEFLIKNYTLPGHIFYPGEVTRKVIDTGSSIEVVTTGEGVGKRKEFNLLVSPTVWDAADIRLRVQVGLILNYENSDAADSTPSYRSNPVPRASPKTDPLW